MISLPGVSGLPPMWREGLLGIEAAQLMRSRIFRQPPAAAQPLPVLLIPGLFAGDNSMSVMAGWLARAGYKPHRAGMVSNIDCSEASIAKLERRLEKMVANSGGLRAVIVGHSRGGQFARVLAVRRPDLVAGIITLGTPHVETLANTHPLLRLEINMLVKLGKLAARSGRGFSTPDCLGGGCCQDFWAHAEGDFPVDIPFLSLYSRSDGVVRYQSCLDPFARHVEVPGTHCGLGMNRHVYRSLAWELARLAAPASAKADTRTRRRIAA